MFATMNWKLIISDVRGWYGRRVWKAAFAHLPALRIQRTEMRVFMLCQFVHSGIGCLAPLDVQEILVIRQICGRRWFDFQLLVYDVGHEVTDPFRTIFR